MKEHLLTRYEALYNEVLVPVANNLGLLISNHLVDAERIDRVTARAKDPERFIEKSNTKNKNGTKKYSKPLVQIQDQIGARIVVFYKEDVETISTKLLKYFHPIESRIVVPDSEWKFGYFGKHHILALPGDAIPKKINKANAPHFFELQIKTLFQHAWSEANHDLGYKSTKPLDYDQSRRLAFTSAQAWGADRIYQELFLEFKNNNIN